MAARAAPAPAPASSFQQGIQTFIRCFKSEAASHFSKHLQSYPNDFDCLLYRGISYRILGENNKAVMDFSKAESCGTTPSEKMAAKAQKLVTQNHSYTEVKLVLKQATEKYPKEAIGWHFYGVKRHSGGENDDETVLALQNAIELKFRQVFLTHYFLGLVLAFRGQLDEAIMHQQAAVKGDGRTFTIAHIALGELLQRKRSNVQAKSCFLTALELNDTQVQANQGLVAIYLDEGNELEAVTNAATFIEARYPRRSGGGGSGGGGTSGSGGGTSGGGGGTSGGGGGGGDGGNGDDKQAATWKKVKKEATHKATVGNNKDRIYYCIEMYGEKKWVTLDRARHAGAGFKVWIDKESYIEFESSYDNALQIMPDKHESNEGKRIRKANMNIKEIRPSLQK